MMSMVQETALLLKSTNCARLIYAGGEGGGNRQPVAAAMTALKPRKVVFINTHGVFSGLEITDNGTSNPPSQGK